MGWTEVSLADNRTFILHKEKLPLAKKLAGKNGWNVETVEEGLPLGIGFAESSTRVNVPTGQIGIKVFPVESTNTALKQVSDFAHELY